MVENEGKLNLMKHFLAALLIANVFAANLFAWGNPTHFMLGEEVRRLDALPDACYLDRFVISNNSPDVFSLLGPEFAHSDYRFAEILLELAGDDVDKQAFAYGYYSHISADAIVHHEYLPPPGIEHALRELAMSSMIYHDNPSLQQAGDMVVVGYYPQMLREASEMFVQRYGEGRVIEDNEMKSKAKLLIYGMVAQKIIMKSALFQSWASLAMPRSGWIDFYNRSIDSAYSSIIQAALNPHSESHVGHRHDMERDLSLDHLGKKLCDRLTVDLRENERRDYVSIDAELPDDAEREDAILRDILIENEPDDDLGWLSDLYSKLTGVGAAVPVPHLSLLPSYPNPFNSSTKVSVRSDIMVDRVEVSIVNLAGQRVKRLYSGSLSVGVHYFNWNGSDASGRAVASGVYFVIVSSENVSLKQKLLLVK